jgi:septum site-determining protein MinC
MHTRLQLARQTGSQATALEEVKAQLVDAAAPRGVWLDAADRILTLPELRAIASWLEEQGCRLERLEAHNPLALVPAAALGLETQLLEEAPPAIAAVPAPPADALTIHRGTLRSGDHLEVEGSLLVLGDVNPGARVSAGGDVRVWGRLRGVAHAGNRGNRQARIVALQLRPLQLRIAEAVARGPEEQPPAGFCEQAVLEQGAIAIQPAEPQWPRAQASGLSD